MRNDLVFAIIEHNINSEDTLYLWCKLLIIALKYYAQKYNAQNAVILHFNLRGKVYSTNTHENK